MKGNREFIPLVSFPKSGNTWVRFILANLFVKEDVAITFNNINTIMPSAYSEVTDERDKKLIDNVPYLIKEHNIYEDMGDYPFKKAIYIVRDGFDAVYSYWHFVSARMPGFYPNIHVFMRNYYRDWGHWGEHVSSWLNKDKNVLIIKYECLLANPYEEINRILDFLDVSFSQKKIKQAIASSDKSEMRKMKGSQGFMSSKNKSFHFVRSAVSGEGHLNLDQTSKEIFLSLSENAAMMEEFNYLAKGNSQVANLSYKPNSLDNLSYSFYKMRYKAKMLYKRIICG